MLGPLSAGLLGLYNSQMWNCYGRFDSDLLTVPMEWMSFAVLDSWDNVTSTDDDVITAVRGNMAVVPCDVTWSSRPPATLQFHRDSQPLTPASSASMGHCVLLCCIKRHCQIIRLYKSGPSHTELSIFVLLLIF